MRNDATAIYKAAEKAFPASYPVDHYIAILFRFPANEWFTPTNKFDEEFNVVKTFADHNLICVKKVVNWWDGSFKGITWQFFYNPELMYLEK